MRLLLFFLFFLPISAITYAQQDTIPLLNKEIINFVDAKLKKQVGRGECWDLAAQALNAVNAKWDGQYTFGILIDPYKDQVYPGDIIQFEKVKLEYTIGDSKYVEEIPHHTAVIYKVNEAGIYDLAEQNTSRCGRKVGFGNIDLSTVRKGKYYIYRPTQ